MLVHTVFETSRGDHLICDTGISDNKVHCTTIITDDILSRSTNKIIFLVESKETGRNATDESEPVSTTSAFKRIKKDKPDNGIDEHPAHHAGRY